jgi:hypothetical protein
MIPKTPKMPKMSKIPTMPKNAFVLLLGSSAGCATTAGPVDQPRPAPVTTQEPAPPAGSEAALHVDENLGKLRALAVFEVGAMVVDAPQGAYSCYGVCPEHREAVAAAEKKSAERLERLTAAAAAATADASPATCEKAAIDANLAALQGLRIVAVGALLEDKVEAKPSCYNQPCPAEVEAARQRTCERAAKLAGIAAAAKRL